ncbi:hypothetical protein [Rhodoblastus acidophilus]|uniref:hypothetical protein n=1 Tax=Rhodoblastus acidophilus TaxID=1074 RepID=UPI001304F356|nr:hypothetical protein [Rhodoblastus acidophilus]
MTYIDSLIDELWKAQASNEVDWDTVRCVAIEIDKLAETKEQKAAAEQLKALSPGMSFGRVISAIHSAFLTGKPDVDGWPRR